MDRSRTAATRRRASQAPSAARAARARQRAFCVAALPEGDDLAELRELLRTAGVAVVGEMVQHREQPHPNTYLGPGKVDGAARRRCRACDANLIACDDELTPRQERNLEEALGLPVVDRTTVILDIFAGHAHSAEGKLQVELAQLEYNLARMRGLWTPPRAPAAAASAPAARARRRSRPTAAWRATASRRCGAAWSTSSATRGP